MSGNDVFDVDSDVTMDFAGSSYLDTDTLKTVLGRGTIAASDPGVSK